MGIDIYAEWHGMTKGERDAQRTGFSAVHGHAGYLREAYHGGPYVTKYLLAEAFAAIEHEARIPAQRLRTRLPIAVVMHLYREHKLYGDGKNPARVDFEDLERALHDVMAREMTDHSHQAFADALSCESIANAKRLIAGRILPDTALSFVDFVELCERKEAELGQPCLIVVSA